MTSSFQYPQQEGTASHTEKFTFKSRKVSLPASRPETGPESSPSNAANTVKSEEGLTKQPHASIPLSKTRKTILLVTMASAGLLNIFVIQSTVIMLHSIREALKTPQSRQQMITSTYNISAGCLILLWGRLADIFGRRLVFLIGLTLFTLSTLVIPFSPVEECFLVLQAFQGLSAAALVPSAIGILGSVFPAGKERTYAFVTFSAASSAGSVLGNVAGGAIGSFLSWKWVFWISAILAGGVTIAAFMVAPAARQIDGDEGAKNRSVDWIGGISITATLSTLLVALSERNLVEWRTSWVIVLLIVSALLLLCLILWQRHLERTRITSPLMKISMFKNHRFSAAFIVIGVFFASHNSYLIFATLFYQDYLGLSSIQTTLRFLPGGIVGCLAAFAVAPMILIVRPLYLIIAGITCRAISPLLFALITMVVAVLALRGLQTTKEE